MKILAMLIALAVAGGVATADPSVADLQKQRAELAEKVYKQLVTQLAGASATAETAYAWSVRWMESERDRTADPKARAKAVADHAARMKALEALATARRNQGTMTTTDADAVTFFRVEADLWVLTKK
jgi:hypothetical protein